MLLHNNAQLDTQRLSRQVRRRFESCEELPGWKGEDTWRESLEGRMVELGATRQYQVVTANDYASLLGLPDPAFVEEAYRHLLDRSPSVGERHRLLDRLMAGGERERILLELFNTARNQGIKPDNLPGLANGLAKARVKHIPKIGKAIRWVLSALRLTELRERLHHVTRLQDARYQALLDLHRQQAQAIEELQGVQVRLRVENELLAQRLTRQPVSEDTAKGLDGQRQEASEHAVQDESNGGERDFYRALEARFRGEPGIIAELMREHLPFVKAVRPLQEGMHLLDLGCGRGEWLGLLRSEGITARGVDLNLENVRACREEGLEVAYQDALAALDTCQPSSLGMITAYHLVEHLTFNQLRTLFAYAFKALAPDGKLLLETPNPQNLIVGSCSFYLDPTHQRPLPPDLLAFVAEFTGFDNVEVVPLHAVGREQHLTEESETARRVNHYLYGPQDYALLATKSSGAEAKVHDSTPREMTFSKPSAALTVPTARQESSS